MMHFLESTRAARAGKPGCNPRSVSVLKKDHRCLNLRVVRSPTPHSIHDWKSAKSAPDVVDENYTTLVVLSCACNAASNPNHALMGRRTIRPLFGAGYVTCPMILIAVERIVRRPTFLPCMPGSVGRCGARIRRTTLMCCNTHPSQPLLHLSLQNLRAISRNPKF